jgi:hypothetical protein
MPTSFKIPVDGSGLGQLVASTCWLASYKMLLRTCGLPFGGIRRDIEAAKLNYQDYYDNGLPRGDYLKVRDALKLSSTRGQNLRNLADDAQGFCRFLMNNGPFWCSIERSGRLHIILVNGFDGKLKQVQAMNPWNNVNAGEAETMYIPAADFQTWVTTDPGSCQHSSAWKPLPFDPSNP